ncbi:hypothetical protein AMATHDRAFT_71733 [Amanita thiersii Skay4041]|uniref:DUF6533 domain-containing protein n=1 Tax=Amanita thiersii Skay4041 TaxID=703135 RepID=A0A2A9NCA7_9AGAR|nr:hypothetical protein AMATHDRAFT_71733 [Amanita thiersii Skay4041]
MLNESPETLARLAFIRFCTTIASTALLALETALLFKEEYRFVWRARISVAKCIYIFSRYFILLFQIANAVIVSTYLRVIPVSRPFCAVWFCTQLSTAALSMVMLEAVLMLRVYALHGKSRKIGITLSCSLFIEICVTTCMISLVFKDLTLDDACVTTNTPRQVIGLGTVTVVQQLLIWGLMFQKRSFLQTLNNAGQRLTLVIMRDGTWVLIGVCACCALLIPYSMYIGQITHVIFSMLIPLFSILLSWYL